MSKLYLRLQNFAFAIHANVKPIFHCLCSVAHSHVREHLRLRKSCSVYMYIRLSVCLFYLTGSWCHSLSIKMRHVFFAVVLFSKKLWNPSNTDYATPINAVISIEIAIWVGFASITRWVVVVVVVQCCCCFFVIQQSIYPSFSVRRTYGEEKMEDRNPS